MLMDNFSRSIYKNGKLFFKVKADEVKIAPKKFLVFNLAVFNELLLKNVAVELHLENNESAGKKIDEVNLFNSIIEAKYGENGAKIRNGFTFRVFTSNALTLELKAASADFKTANNIVFHDATLEHFASGRRIKAKKIYWDDPKSRFMVAGFYEASSPKGKARGRGLIVDLNFNLEPLRSPLFHKK
jgi:flagellar basal body P-ring protein FlgI